MNIRFLHLLYRVWSVMTLTVLGSPCVFYASNACAQAQPATPIEVGEIAPALHWTFTVRGSGGKAPTDLQKTTSDSLGNLREVETIRYGGLQRQTLKWADGKQDIIYYVQGHQLFQNPRNPSEIVVFGLERDTEMEDRLPNWNYYGIAWITSGDKIADVVYEGHPCYHYVEKRNASGRGNREAWIEKENNRPIAVKTQDGLISYTHLSPPVSTLDAPAPFLAAWKRYQLELNQLERLRMPQTTP